MPDVAKFVRRNHLRVEVIRGSIYAQDKSMSTVVLKKGKRKLCVPYGVLPRSFDECAFLQNFMFDIVGFEMCHDFQDWCRLYGYEDTDSVASRIYEQLAIYRNALVKLFGKEQFEAAKKLVEGRK